MKFNVINMFDEFHSKLYSEVLGLAHGAVRHLMEREAQVNGMCSNALDEFSRFRFFDLKGSDQALDMQNSFVFRGRIYNVNIVMHYKGEYYIPRYALVDQFETCWGEIITPCLLPMFVETDDCAGMVENKIPSFSNTFQRREFNSYWSGDDLGETLRVDIPELVFPQLIRNPLSINEDWANCSQFEECIVHLDYNKELDYWESLRISLPGLEPALQAQVYSRLGLRDMTRKNPNVNNACEMMEKAAEGGDVDAAKWLFGIYYYGMYDKEKDFAKAAKYIQQIVECDCPNRLAFMVYIGDMYRMGEGFEKDIDKAIETYKEACPDEWAYFNLAEVYATGEGVAADMDLAKHYYALAAEQDLLGKFKESLSRTTPKRNEVFIENDKSNIRHVEELAQLLAANGDELAARDLEDAIPQIKEMLANMVKE